ncbi:MAG: SPOR domain-containing protein [Rickettsiales bacterium]|jgi:hypothetical protein|nr:SPOR domain-containing protein [Rickettsiales bacterium]
MDKIAAKAEKYKKELLILITCGVVGVFCFVLYKSYKISKIRQDLDSLPLIRSKIEQIKVKKIQEDGDNNSAADGIIGGDDGGKIDVATDGNSENVGLLTLNNKISELTGEDGDENGSEKREEADAGGSAPSPIGDGDRGQVVALQSEKQTEDFIRTLKREYDFLLKDRKVFHTRADLGERGVFYRVQVGFFERKDEATAFCKKYLYLDSDKKDLLNCIVLR